jgi:hypothetical protein
MVSMLEIAGHVAKSTSLRGQSLNKENDKAHNSGPTNYLPKITQSGILTKKYFLSFRFFHLASFLFMFPPSWRSALAVAKDGACGGGTDTSCPLGPGITPTWSTFSATSGANGADSWRSGGNPGASSASGGGSRATIWKAMVGLGGVTSATWQPSRVSLIHDEGNHLRHGNVARILQFRVEHLGLPPHIPRNIHHITYFLHREGGILHLL